MSGISTQRAFQRAQDQLGRGQVPQAIDTLAGLLGDDPEHADAHALLAICLVRRKRLHAARMEAEQALALDPDSVFSHQAAAVVASADRRFSQAEHHLAQALAIEPESVQVLELQARHYAYWGRMDQARDAVARALVLAPGHPDVLALEAEVALRAGDIATAGQSARAALAQDPEQLAALVALGHVALANGQADQAREHLSWALSLDPNDSGAIELLCALKARHSPLLGLWWRFQRFVATGSTTRMVALLLGFFLAYRTAYILLVDQGQQQFATPLQVAWLAFCAYTWVAPAMFRRMVERELSDVRLRPDF